jgi:hypothetical protein
MKMCWGCRQKAFITLIIVANSRNFLDDVFKSKKLSIKWIRSTISIYIKHLRKLKRFKNKTSVNNEKTSNVLKYINYINVAPKLS